MVNPAELMTVTGSTSFGGGDETGQLTAGTLRTSNQFLQDATTSTSSFLASGTHTVEIVSQNGTGGVVNLATPTASHFQNLRVLFISNFASDVAVNGNFEVNFNAAANFFAKRVTVGGTFSQSGIGFFGPTRLRLLGGNAVTGGTLGPDTLEFVGSAPQTYPNVNFSFPKTVLIANDVTAATGVANIANDLEVQGTGIFRLGSTGSTFNVGGNLRTVGSGRLEMIDPGSTITVTGDATFSGGDETGLLTAGSLQVQGNFTQGGSVPTSFLATAAHLTKLGAAAARSVSFTGAGSQFGLLDVSSATGGLTVLGGGVRADTLISSGAARIIGTGASLPVMAIRRAQVNGLLLDKMAVNIDEGTVGHPQQFDNVTYSNLPATGAFPLVFTGPGGAAAPRSITFNNVNYPTLAAGAGNFYVAIASTNGFGLQLTMMGSNQGAAAGGNGAALTQATNGASVLWP
jgi:hypothetical protein